MASPESFPLAEIFADESSQNAHRYLVLGALLLEKSASEAVADTINKERLRHGFGRELKWARVSSAKLQGYMSVVDSFIDLLARNEMRLHVLVADSSTMDHKRHNHGDREIGFNKLIYQLLLHKCGRREGARFRLEAYLDRRKTTQDPETMRVMLNAHLARDYDITHRPFRSIMFRDSKDCDQIQICDVMIGAIAYRKNRHHRAPGANEAKCQLAAHIVRRLHALEAPVRATGSLAKRFTYWEFRYTSEARRGTPQA